LRKIIKELEKPLTLAPSPDDDNNKYEKMTKEQLAKLEGDAKEE